MAYNYHYRCIRCHKETYGPRDRTMCYICEDALRQEGKDKHLEELQQQSIEERVQRLEEFVYNQINTPNTYRTLK